VRVYKKRRHWWCWGHDAEGERRDVRITVRVSATERQRLEDAAERERRVLSDWIRCVRQEIGCESTYTRPSTAC
jgi:hypothetical protein